MCKFNFDWFKSVLNIKSPYSSKSLILLVTGFVGNFLALVLGVILIVDVCNNGKIDSSLTEMAVFLAAIGSYIWMGGINKVNGDKNRQDFYKSQDPESSQASEETKE